MTTTMADRTGPVCRTAATGGGAIPSPAPDSGQPVRRNHGASAPQTTTVNAPSGETHAQIARGDAILITAAGTTAHGLRSLWRATPTTEANEMVGQRDACHCFVGPVIHKEGYGEWWQINRRGLCVGSNAGGDGAQGRRTDGMATNGMTATDTRPTPAGGAMAPRRPQLGARRQNHDEGVDRQGALDSGQGEMTTEEQEATVPWQQEGFVCGG